MAFGFFSCVFELQNLYFGNIYTVENNYKLSTVCVLFGVLCLPCPTMKKELLSLPTSSKASQNSLCIKKKYQAQKPLVHDLHNLIKEAYAGLLLPEKIPACSTSKLISLEFRDEYQLRDRDLAVGKFCKPVLTTCLKNKKRNTWINKFYQALREGHIGMGEYLQKNFQWQTQLSGIYHTLTQHSNGVQKLYLPSVLLQKNFNALLTHLPWVDLMLSSVLTRPWKQEK